MRNFAFLALVWWSNPAAAHYTSPKFNWAHSVAVLMEKLWSDPLYIERERESEKQFALYNQFDGQPLHNFTRLNELRYEVTRKYSERIAELSREALEFASGQVAYTMDVDSKTMIQFQFQSRIFAMFDIDRYAHSAQWHMKQPIHFEWHRDHAIPALRYYAWTAYASLVRSTLALPKFIEMATHYKVLTDQLDADPNNPIIHEIAKEVQTRREQLQPIVQPEFDRMRFIFDVAYETPGTACSVQTLDQDIHSQIPRALQWDTLDPQRLIQGKPLRSLRWFAGNLLKEVQYRYPTETDL